MNEESNLRKTGEDKTIKIDMGGLGDWGTIKILLNGIEKFEIINRPSKYEGLHGTTKHITTMIVPSKKHRLRSPDEPVFDPEDAERVEYVIIGKEDLFA